MAPLDLSDPRWFPADYLAGSDQFRMIRLDIDAIGASSFLDKRLRTANLDEVLLDAATLQVNPPVRAPALLFHTAFCGSTLLARALHSPPDCVSLKEPSALLSLSSMSLNERTPGCTNRIDHRLASALALLGRGWGSDGQVLIKPTNQVNRLMARILRTRPDSRAVLLYSSLEDFLVSCFKKLPLAETRIRWMAQHLLVGSQLSARLQIPPFHPFTLPESCVFAWYAQIERYAQVLDEDQSDRLRTLDMQTMLGAPLSTVGAAGQWLGLPSPQADLENQVANVFQRDSKSTERSYSPGHRETEKASVQKQFGEIIQRTMDWASADIAPHCRMPIAWKTLNPN